MYLNISKDLNKSYINFFVLFYFIFILVPFVLFYFF